MDVDFDSKPSPPSSNFVLMEFCVNCGDSVDDSSPSSASNLCKSEDFLDPQFEDPLTTAKYLTSIFRLNYLTAFIDPPHFHTHPTKSKEAEKSGQIEDEDLSLIWNGDLNLRLCTRCQSIFTNLWKYYEDFIRLSSLQGRLIQTIQQLDICIQNCKVEKANRQNSLEKPAPSTCTVRAPLVVLTRLENDSTSTSNNINKRKKEGRIVMTSKRKVQRVKQSAYYETESSDDEQEGKQVEVDPLADQGQVEDQVIENNFDLIPSSDSSLGAQSDSSDPESNKIEVKNSRTKTKPEKMKESQELKEYFQRKHLRARKQRLYATRKLKVANPCWLCDLHFPTQADCLAHTKSKHFHPSAVLCQVCSYVAVSKQSLEHHKKMCKSLMPGKIRSRLKCPLCPRFLNTQEYLDIHLKTIHVDRDVMSCDIPGCSFKTKSVASFKVHKRNLHELQNEPEELRKCGVCNRVFKSSGHLKDHQKTFHTVEGMIKYQEYAKKVKEKQREKRNQRPVVIESTVCSHCGVDFLSVQGLRFHEKKFHSTSFSFVCETCGEGFNRKGSLNKHLVTVHSNGVRGFFCEHCGKSYKSNGALRRHINISHDEEGRLKFNAQIRLYNHRKKIIRKALGQGSAPASEATTLNESSSSSSDPN